MSRELKESENPVIQPLTGAQRNVWFHQRIDLKATSYNAGQHIVIEGHLDTERLDRIQQALATQTEVLHVRFVESDQEPYQAHFALDVPMLAQWDLREDPTPELTGEKLLYAQQHLPFDLQNGPLFRFGLIRLADERWIWFWFYHHIIMDGAGVASMLSRLVQSYCANELIPPETSLTWSQAVQEDWAYRQSSQWQADLEYWMQTLESIQIPATLSAHPPLLGDLQVCQTVSNELDRNDFNQIIAWGKENNLSAYPCFGAAVLAYLSRMTGETDLCLGCPTDGRNRRTRATPGMLTNVLSLRAKVALQDSLVDIARQLSIQLKQALRHRQFPLGEIVKHRLRQNLSEPFSILVNLESFDHLADFGTAQGTLYTRTSEPIADLQLFIFDRHDNGTVELRLAYNARRYSESEAKTHLSRMTQLIKSLPSASESNSPSLSLLDSTQRDNVIRESCGPLTELSAQPQNLPALFAAQLARTPDGCALLFEQSADQATDASMSFAELDAQSNQLARHLIATGIAADQIVAILLERSPQMIVAMLAVLKAGAAYLPLDPDLPASRLQFMLTDSQSQLLLTSNVRAQALQQGLASLTPHTAEPQNALPTLLDLTDPQVQHLLQALPTQEISAQERPQPLLPEHLAYLIYTSGSTGTPKGAGNTHHAVVNRLLWMQDTMRLGTQDRVLQKTAIGFDVAVWEWFLPLMTGAALVIARPEGQKDPAYLKSVIEQHRVSVLHFVPSMLAVFLEALESHQCNTIRQIVTSGEALSGTVQAQTFARLPHTRLWNLYGPTEAAIDVSVWSCSAQDGAQTPPIGHPIWNTQLYILDAMLEPLPHGVMGELYIAGTGLARGYLGRSGLTAERFIACPLGLPGARMYRTGDLARRRADGAIEYLGRADDQVKVRGYRIELGEIEAAFLAQDTTLAQVAVITRMIQGDQRLVAYLVARAGQPAPDTDRLRATLLSTLPEYMVPAYFVTIDALPLSANGKLDRRALPEPAIQSSTQDYRAPRNHAETLLCNLFAEITGAEQVGIDDGFFALGGHSLLAMRLIARLRRDTGHDLALRTLFDCLTPELLAPHIESIAQDQGPELIAGMGQLSDDTVALSYGQNRLWTLDRVDGASATYNMAVAIYLSGDLDIQALRQSLIALVARHQPLRTVISEDDDGMPFGRLLSIPSTAAILNISDLTLDFEHHPVSAQEKLNALIEYQATQPFDLQHDLPLRAQLTIYGKKNSVLSLTLHHHAGDGISANIIAKELEQAYQAYRQGHAPAWAPIAVQYSDWAIWQKQTLERDIEPRLERARQRLADMPELLTLPVDHPRTAQRAHRAGYLPVNIPAQTVQRLEQLARAQGTTLFTVVLAAYAATLSRIAGQTEVVIGAPVAGRQRMETENLVGLLVNTLALPLSTAGNCTGQTLIARARECVQSALNDQDLPFERLVEGLNVNRSLMHAPVFQVMLAYQTDAVPEFKLQGLTCRSTPIDLPTAKFDLILFIGIDAAGNLSGNFEFDADLFDTASVESWNRCLLNLTADLATSPESPVKSFALIDRIERNQILAGAAGEAFTPEPSLLTLPALVDAQCRLRPQANALVYEQGEQSASMSYAELDTKSNQLARYLIAKHVGPDQVVAILLNRSTNMIISMLGVLKAGAAYLPIDPDHPVARLQFMLADSQAQFVITTTSYLASLQSESTTLPVAIDLDDPSLCAELRQLPGGTITQEERVTPLLPKHLAYLIYTSGSTGLPKGAGNSHEAVVNHMDWMQSVLHLGADDRILQKTAIGFDVAVWEWFLPLMTGATLVIAKPDGHKEPAYLRKVIEQHSITVVHFVASMQGMFIEELEQGECKSIRQIVTSGEALTGSLQAQTFERLPGIKLWDFYGPTEAAIHVAQWRCRVEDGIQTPPIGYPIWNTQLYILDSMLEPVPNGVVGELYIAGKGLARGYLGRAGLTAERFIACPFGPDGACMYRTGDLARKRMDGAIEYLGRADDQVKIRGYRIELGEIETTLLEGFETLSQVAVIARKINGDQRLVAYLVARAEKDVPNVSRLRETLLATLPDYMVPTYFVTIEKLPLNANGKLDRRALPEPNLDLYGDNFRAPQSKNEILICRLFSEITGNQNVGLDDNFFAIGGHSLLAMRLVAQVRQQSGITIALRTLFECPTPASLAQHLETLATDQGPQLIAGMGRINDDTVALSYGQSRLWTLDRVDGASATYNMAVAVYLDGILDIPALRQSLVALVSRHQSLRTVLTEDDEGTPLGRLLPVPSSADILTISDLTERFAYDPVGAEEKLKAVIDSQAAQPFDLQHDLPLRAHLTISANTHAVLSLTLHHHAGDGVSAHIIANELEQAYQAYKQGKAPDWAPISVQYSDWAVWQQRTLEASIGPKIERASKRLANMPELLTLPLDHPRLAQRTHRAGYLPISIPAQTVQQLEGLAQTQGTTLFTVVLAAYAATLGRLAGQTEVVIGAPVAGRNHTEIENLVGFLLNTLALPISIAGDCSGLTLIERARETVEAALDDQDLPFEKLLDGLNLSRSMVNTPVFQAMFAFQSDAIPRFSLQGLACRSQVVALPTAKFDLTLHLSKESDGSLLGDFEFDADLFDQSSVLKWADAFYSVTASLCLNPEQSVTLLPLMDPAAQQACIARSSGEHVTIEPEYLVFTQAFEAQVEREPHAIALIADHETMSYRELDQASNRLARYILQQGVQTDQIVGILIDRSPAMIIAILATLKAGAAYLPLDSNYPSVRLSYMLTDSRAIALLCTRHRYDALLSEDSDIALPPAWVLDDLDVANHISTLSTDSLTRDELKVPVSADNLVYVMYTSGSTGLPKGVSFLHGALGNLVKWKEGHLPSTTPRVLQYSPVGFDASAQEIASAFCCGAALVLVDEECRRDSRALLEHMHAQKVEHLFAPFVVLASLAEARNSFDHEGWPQAVFTAGEQLQITPEIRSAFMAHPKSRLHNFYGPTEAHVVSNFSLSADPTEWNEFPPIGEPIWNTQLYILDASLNVVPDGIVGELYIAGIGLARGYIGKPGMTAEKFMACPFGEPGTRMYRTGDLARRCDGQIYFLGRADEQVKLRGFRIEMGEIEAALLKYFDCFAQVAVIARDVNAIKSLIAYFVTYPNQTAPDHSMLCKTLAAHLPEYMIPSYFLAVDSLPLTPNGKLDRRALPVPEGRTRENAYRAPTTDNEILLCQLFSEITGTEQVSLDDSFFAIGGHSLLAMRLIARLRSENGTVLPLRTLFEFTTPESLAPHLDSLEDDDEPMLIRGFGRITEN